MPWDEPLALRGHHLLCQFGYRGHGYSKAFTDNMTAVLTHLGRHGESLVCLTDTPDILCRKFPSDQPNHCHTPEVIHRDQAILDRLDLRPGHVIAWSELVERATHEFCSEDLLTLCSTCSWLPLGYCQQGLHEARLNPGSRPIPSAARRREP